MVVRDEERRPAVPIYAYHCRSCGNDFSTLVRGGETPDCPSCTSVDLKRQLSLIASPLGRSEATAPSGCGIGAGAPACGAPVCGCPAFAD